MAHRNRWFTELKNGGSFHGYVTNNQMVYETCSVPHRSLISRHGVTSWKTASLWGTKSKHSPCRRIFKHVHLHFTTPLPLTSSILYISSYSPFMYLCRPSTMYQAWPWGKHKLDHPMVGLFEAPHPTWTNPNVQLLTYPLRRWKSQYT